VGGEGSQFRHIMLLFLMTNSHDGVVHRIDLVLETCMIDTIFRTHECDDFVILALFFRFHVQYRQQINKAIYDLRVRL